MNYAQAVVTAITAVCLYGLFSITAALAGAAGILGGILRRDAQYTANVMHSMDMLLAALLGWNGRATVSKECGAELAAGRPCRFCRAVCAVLSYKLFGRFHLLEPEHCAREARK